MDPATTIHNLMQHISRSMLISENTALRLFNSVSATNLHEPSPPPPPPIPQQNSLMSVQSSNEFGNSCRICRWHQSDMQLQRCPCMCKGSVGYVHAKCLRVWILHRGDNRCEICGKRFNLDPALRDYRKLFRAFFQSKYLGAILKNCIQLATLAPISYIILYQVFLITEHLQNEDNSILKVVFLTPALLFSTSILFFHMLEFGVTRCMRIKSLISHWWTFGGHQSENGMPVELPNEIFDFF